MTQYRYTYGGFRAKLPLLRHFINITTDVHSVGSRCISVCLSLSVKVRQRCDSFFNVFLVSILFSNMYRLCTILSLCFRMLEDLISTNLVGRLLNTCGCREPDMWLAPTKGRQNENYINLEQFISHITKENKLHVICKTFIAKTM